jgi:hypothetical protein
MFFSSKKINIRIDINNIEINLKKCQHEEERRQEFDAVWHQRNDLAFSFGILRNEMADIENYLIMDK